MVTLAGDDPMAAALAGTIRGGDIESLRRLLADRPDLAKARIGDRSESSRTPLHIVTDWPGHVPNGPAVARLLLDAGADPNATAGRSETPLHWAASSDDAEVAAVLVDGGADLEAPGGSIGTPLANAVGYGCWDVARLLVARGAVVDRLWIAAALGRTQDVEQQFASEPAPTQEEIDEAFWQACHGGQRRMAEYLLARGAGINARPRYAGRSALDIAGSVDTRHDLLVSWLQEHGAEPSPPDVDLHALLDLQTPWCLHVAATLRIADLIAAGTDRVDELAAAAGCDAEALHALLGYLAGKGVFVRIAPGRFGLNRAAEKLRKGRQFLDLDGIAGRMALGWGALLTLVRTGKPGYADLFGLPFWEDLAAHPEVAASFDALMGPAGHGTPDYDLDLDGGWDGVGWIVDVGGGTGAFLAELLRRHPAVRGTLVDLSGTVARSGELFAASGVADRVTASGQSFFDPLPAGADVYVLKKVLNDWPDDETVAILRRCAEAARPNGRVVVLGGVAPDDAVPMLTNEMPLVGGRTSTVSRFRELAAQAGLAVAATGEQAGRLVVECRPA